MSSPTNKSWNLESFLDSLILELDKAQDTLSVKGLTRPLTYTVQDVALELQIFPDFSGEEVRFRTAQPGEAGASKISMQLGSITDRQIRETTKEPPSKDDVVIDDIETLDEGTKRSLKKLGVRSARDIERMERRNVDLKKASPSPINYDDLAGLINKARRKTKAPAVRAVSVAQQSADAVVLALEGENLRMMTDDADFPLAQVNAHPVEVVTATDRTLHVKVPRRAMQRGADNELQVALDPYAAFRLTIHA